ncbi:MAG TPA: hypothetical protein EYH05_07220 [Anaerolineae bacterium]|nr:hypothetical protein [Anaerolineae bacterium]
MEELLARLQAAQAELEPQFKALRGAMGALRTAARLAAAERQTRCPCKRRCSNWKRPLPQWIAIPWIRP